MKNTYYIMRHGESKANRDGIIISDPGTGSVSYGLTENGREQAALSITKSGICDTLDCIYTSDFLRAFETAAIASESCGAVPVHKTPALGERFFGIYNKCSDDNYRKIWKIDDKQGDYTISGAEAPAQVSARIIEHIRLCEKKHDATTILLVSHGDPLQILIAAAAGKPVSLHRTVKHLQTAEIRKLEYRTDIFDSITI